MRYKTKIMFMVGAIAIRLLIIPRFAHSDFWYIAEGGQAYSSAVQFLSGLAHSNIWTIKLTYLVFDGIMTTVLGWVWLLSPVVIYSTYLFGQFDIIPVTLFYFSIIICWASMSMWTRNIVTPYIVAGLLCGMAIMLKTFPLLLIPIMARCIPRQKIRFVFIGIIAILLVNIRTLWTIVPQIYYPSADTSQILRYFSFALLYLAVLKSNENIMKSITAGTLALYALFFTPIHYFMWCLPFLIYSLKERYINKLSFWGIIVSLFVYNLNSFQTTTGLLIGYNGRGLVEIMHSLGIPYGYVLLFGQVAFYLFLGYTTKQLLVDKIK